MNFNRNIKIKLILGIFTLHLCNVLNAQSYTPPYLLQPDNFIQQNFDVIDPSGWLRAFPESNVSFSGFITQNKSSLGMRPDDNFRLVKKTDDDYPFMDQSNRMMHHRYNQTYKGIDVEYAELFLHHKNNRIELINGKLAEGLNMSVTPALTEADALSAAIQHLGSTNLYTWQDPEWEADYQEEKEDPLATTYPKGALIIAKLKADENYAASQFVLAWAFSIQSLQPAINVTLYINAQTGAYIKQTDNIMEGNADLSYGYGNNMWIDTKWRGGWWDHFILHTNDISGRNIYTKEVKYGGIFGGDWVSNFGGNNKNNSHDDDDRWYGERAAETTPHWVMTQTWEYYKNTFNRSSIDNAGKQLNVYANGKELNATYDKKNNYFIFGRNGSKHLGTKDICGHEYTHGVTDYAAGLVYANEPGALNESFSDIFGYEVERYLNSGTHINWNMGEDADWLTRRMNNPSKSEISPCHGQAQPAFYKGARWYTGTCDNGGVHINSGVQNYWFYLLCQGSAGAPDGTFAGIAVSGIGADKARNITYYNLDVLMGKNSTYNDASVGSIFAASIIYGNCSREEIQTRKAWNAVNLGNGKGPLSISGPGIIYRTAAGSVVGSMPKTYAAAGGISSRYRWTYSGPWTYTVTGTGRGEFFNITNFSGGFTPGTIELKNGCETVSKRISFSCIDCFPPVGSNDGSSTLRVYPNPATSFINITASFINGSLPDPIYVTMIDANGMYQLQQSFQQQIPQNISVGNLIPGRYTLIVQQGNNVGYTQFIKQ